MALEAARRQAESERQMAYLDALAKKKNTRSDDTQRDRTPPLNKETIDRIRNFRRIDPAEQAKYAAFLSGEHTGMLKFFPDFNCLTLEYIRIDGDCAASVPNSYAFSFRAYSYADDYYHDIAFKPDAIVSTGFYSQGMLVSLGDVPIDKINTSSAGIKYLMDFQPDLNPSAARKTAARLAEGVDSGGFKYARSVKTAENMTYAVRVIAYRNGNSLPPLSDSTTTMEKRFMSLAYDKREDLIVVFRIVKLDASGGVTMLWKELDRREAPKLKFAKGESLSDIKP